MELTRRQAEIMRLALSRLSHNYDKISISYGSMKINDELISAVKPSEIDMLFQDVQNARLSD